MTTEGAVRLMERCLEDEREEFVKAWKDYYRARESPDAWQATRQAGKHARAAEKQLRGNVFIKFAGANVEDVVTTLKEQARREAKRELQDEAKQSNRHTAEGETGSV